MNAEQIMILSASGSIRMPKLVMSLRRARDAAVEKIRDARQAEKTSASVSWNGIGENSAQRKSAVSAKRETVSLLGRFIC